MNVKSKEYVNKPLLNKTTTVSSSRTVEGVDLRKLAFWNCGFESSEGMNICLWECCVLSGRGLCDGPITPLEK
jgi:hypothetical protein